MLHKAEKAALEARDAAIELLRFAKEEQSNSRKINKVESPDDSEDTSRKTKNNSAKLLARVLFLFLKKKSYQEGGEKTYKPLSNELSIVFRLQKRRGDARKRVASAHVSVADTEELWRDQYRTLCDGLAILLRALGHSSKGWVRAWLSNGAREPRYDRKLKAFRTILVKDRIGIADTVLSDFPDLADYISSFHSLCTDAQTLWNNLDHPLSSSTP